MARIFISYNRCSLEAVQTLAEDLKASDHEMWFDQSLTGGQRWWDKILASIRECDIFVFTLTPESLESQACTQELNYAGQLGKVILPVLLSDAINVNVLPRSLNEIQFVDYRRQDKQAAFALIKAIKNLPEPVPLPDPLPQPPAVPVSYLSNLKERIDTPQTLNFQEQIALVFDLKDHLREGRSVAEVCDLLARLRQRDDLLAKVGVEIDIALASINDPSSPSPPKRDSSPPITAATELSEIFSVAAIATADAEEPIGLDRAAAETERLLHRVLDHQETWTLEGDDQNYVAVSSDPDSTTTTVSATATFRDGFADSKAEALQALGWNISGNGWKMGLTGGAIYATSGIGALALLSSKVRNYLLSNDATRDWVVTSSRRELATIAGELTLVLQKIAPEAQTVSVKKQ
jgi:TIR domain